MKILKFGHKGCEGCKIMAPRFAEIEKENPDLITEYYDVEDDKNRKILEKFNIEHAPVFVFIDQKGNEIERLLDIHPKEEILELIDKYKNR